MALKRILITNAKGGCGKTTITTNIASHYAQQGLNVRLFDHDNQGSSIAWNNRRPDSLNRIHVVDASKNVDHRMTRSWQLRVPLDTDIAVIDSPAGIEVSELTTLFQQNDAVIIPVVPSPIDIHATAHFIKELLTTGKARKRMVRLAVVANRVRKHTIMYRSLERFLFSLNIPFVSSLSDTQLYSQAFELGVGVQELRSSRSRIDREQWAPIMRWIETPVESKVAEIRPLFSKEEH
jgi:chromosome partitioning protein